jgi:hypothetical protein
MLEAFRVPVDDCVVFPTANMVSCWLVWAAALYRIEPPVIPTDRGPDAAKIRLDAFVVPVLD